MSILCTALISSSASCVSLWWARDILSLHLRAWHCNRTRGSGLQRPSGHLTYSQHLHSAQSKLNLCFPLPNLLLLCCPLLLFMTPLGFKIIDTSLVPSSPLVPKDNGLILLLPSLINQFPGSVQTLSPNPVRTLVAFYMDNCDSSLPILCPYSNAFYTLLPD